MPKAQAHVSYYLGFGVQGLGFGVQGLRVGVHGVAGKVRFQRCSGCPSQDEKLKDFVVLAEPAPATGPEAVK